MQKENKSYKLICVFLSENDALRDAGMHLTAQCYPPPVPQPLVLAPGDVVMGIVQPSATQPPDPSGPSRKAIPVDSSRSALTVRRSLRRKSAANK